jgi:hypothetical protein
MDDREVFRKARRRTDPGDCGAPCDDERGGPRKPLSDVDVERQRRRILKGNW